MAVAQNDIETLHHKAMTKFLTDKQWQWRQLRTIAQGALGVFVANIDTIIGMAALDYVGRGDEVTVLYRVASRKRRSPDTGKEERKRALVMEQMNFEEPASVANERRRQEAERAASN